MGIRFLLLWGWRLLLAGIIGFGLLFAAIRLLLPGVAGYQTYIEELATEALGRPVTIRQVESGWSGLRPVVTLKGVRLQPVGSQSAIHIDSLDVVFGITPSLLAGELSPVMIVLYMQQLEFNGHSGSDLNNMMSPVSSGLVEGWLGRTTSVHINIDAFSFNDEAGEFPDILLRDIELDIIHHRDSLLARLKAGSSQFADQLNLMVDWDTRQLASEIYNADLHLELKTALLPFWKPVLANFFEIPDAGKADIVAWVQVEASRVKQVVGDILLTDMTYGPRSGEAFSVKSVAGKFSWLSTDAGWLFRASELYVQRFAKRWPETALSVEYRWGEPDRFLINADYLRLQDVLPLIDRQPDVHALIGDKLQSLSLAGDLSELKLQLSTSQQNQLPDYALQVQIADFSVNPYERWPGISGLSGYLVATDQAGLLRLSTEHVLLDFPTVFRNTLRIDTLKGDISWTWLAPGVLVESMRLDANNEHISTRSRLFIHIPEDGDVFLDMETRFQNGDGAYSSLYFPVNVLDEEVVAWLDNGIVAGHVEYGTFILNGRVCDFPFDHSNGRFEVRFKLKDGTLDYYEDWPRIDGLEAEVAFIGKDMHVEISAGKIFESELREAAVNIVGLNSENPVLAVKGQVKAFSKDLSQYLIDTKLVHEYEAALSALTFQGMNHIRLVLDIPLSGGRPRVKGVLELLGNQLRVDDWGLQFDQVEGSLSFTEKSFSSKNIAGLLDSQKVDVTVETLQKSGAPETRISARGQIDLSRFVQSKNEVLARQFSGKSPFEVLVHVPENGSGRLMVYSPLVGTELRFPYPFHKKSGDKLEFSLQTGFSGELIEVNLGDRFRALFGLDTKTHELVAAHVQFSQAAISRSLDSGVLSLDGGLDYLDLYAWSDWYQRFNILLDKVGSSLVSKTDLKIDQVKYAPWSVEDIHIHASGKDGLWRAELSGQGVKGIAAYDDTESVLNVDLRHLSLLKQEPDKVGSKDRLSTLRPSDMPGIHVDIQKLIYDGREVGQFMLRARPEGSSYLFDEVGLLLEDSDFRISGEWMADSRPGVDEHLTRVKVDAESRDFSELIKRLGYSDTVKGKKSSLRANLEMNTSPMNFDLSRLSGDVELSIFKGEVRRLDPGGIGRVFGLLSFQALPRRLFLDFRDLFGKGIVFDEISGDFVLSQGQAYTNNLVMVSPSGQIDISGRVGLVDEDYDQYVRVTPNLSSALPVVGALTIGTGAAAAMFLTHQLLQEPIDTIAEAEYRITGPWSSPNIMSVGRK